MEVCSDGLNFVCVCVDNYLCELNRELTLYLIHFVCSCVFVLKVHTCQLNEAVIFAVIDHCVSAGVIFFTFRCGIVCM